MAGSALSLGAALHADPLGMPLGCQLYPVRKMLAQDIDGTFKELSAAGFKMVELCSPPGYEKAGFAPLIGLKPAEVKEKFEAAGLGCISCHYGFKELKDNLDDRIEFAKGLGLTQMIVSTFGLKPDATMADWARAAGEMNPIAEKIKKAGMQAGFHNHHFEFKEIDGVLVYDKLMSELDAKLVKMQFQVSVISAGYEAATFLTKYPGRFISLHLADWSSADKKTVAIGKGVVDWKKLFTAAKKGGVKNYFVEMDLDLMKDSVGYLHELKS